MQTETQLNGTKLNPNSALFIALAVMWASGAVMSALPYGFSFGMAIFGKFDMSLTLSQLIIKWGIFANIVMCAYSVFAWQKHSARLLYWRVSFGVILSYTVLATFFTLESWLEPFGALVKNFVLLAVFYGQMRGEMGKRVG